MGTSAGGSARDHESAPTRVRHLEHRVPELSARRVRDARAEHDLLEAESRRRGGELADHVIELPGGECQRRPHVEQDAVPVEAALGRPLRLVEPDGRQRFGQHALEVRQLDHAARGVADRGQVAHLGEREQALVLRVLARDGAEEVDVLHRRQPLDLEVAQPPEVEPLAHHGVQAAVDALLGVSVRLGAEGEVEHVADPGSAPLGRDYDDDAAQRPREANPVEDAAHGGGHGIRILRRRLAMNEEVDHDVVVGGDAGDQARRAPGPRRRGARYAAWVAKRWMRRPSNPYSATAQLRPSTSCTANRSRSRMR